MKTGDLIIYDCHHPACDGLLDFGDTYTLANISPDGRITLMQTPGHSFPLEAFNAANPSHHKPNQWISVDDRYPEKDGLYLCHFTDKTIETFDYQSEDADDRTWGVHNYLVTHWMPLPEPPKGVIP